MQHQFILFIIKGSPPSELAYMQIRSVLNRLLEGQYELEVFDIERHYQRAKQMGVQIAPTLIQKSPAPERTLITGFTNPEKAYKELQQVLPSGTS